MDTISNNSQDLKDINDTELVNQDKVTTTEIPTKQSEADSVTESSTMNKSTWEVKHSVSLEVVNNQDNGGNVEAMVEKIETQTEVIDQPCENQDFNSDNQVTDKFNSYTPLKNDILTKISNCEVQDESVQDSSKTVDTPESSNIPVQTKPLDDIDRVLNNEQITYSSDEEEEENKNKPNESLEKFETSGSIPDSTTQLQQSTNPQSENKNTSSSSSSSSESESSESESSDSDSEFETNEAGSSDNKTGKKPKRKPENMDEDEENDDDNNGPIKSKNEIIDDVAPELAPDFSVPEKAQIEFAGYIHNVSEKMVLIRAGTSGEYRILKENSIFCFEDKTPIGILYETFGRIQSPIYVVKFNSPDKAKSLRDRIGQKVYYVVSSSSFILTAEIKKIKGCDASNKHDEEVPIEEQDYSDDEKELELKRKKKNKKPKNKRKNNEDDHSNTNVNDNNNNRNESRRKNRKMNPNNNNGNGQAYSSYPDQYNSFEYQQNNQAVMGLPQNPQLGYQNNQPVYMDQSQNLLSQLQSLTPQQLSYLQQLASAQQQQVQMPIYQNPINQFQNYGVSQNLNSSISPIPNVASILLQNMQQGQQQMQPEYNNGNQQEHNHLNYDSN